MCMPCSRTVLHSYAQLTAGKRWSHPLLSTNAAAAAAFVKARGKRHTEPVWRQLLRRHLHHSDPAVAQRAAAALRAAAAHLRVQICAERAIASQLASSNNTHAMASQTAQHPGSNQDHRDFWVAQKADTALRAAAAELHMQICTERAITSSVARAQPFMPAATAAAAAQPSPSAPAATRTKATLRWGRHLQPSGQPLRTCACRSARSVT